MAKPTKEARSLRVIEFRSENFKRLRAVTIRPVGDVVQITGANEQGKSSVLDGIWTALGGKAADMPREPIRLGQDRAEVTLQIGRTDVEYTVTRDWWRKDDGTIGTSLTVSTDAKGNIPGPQYMLNSLLGPLTLDPLEFDRMDDKRKVDALKALVPGIDFAAFEKANKADYEERTMVARLARNARAAADTIALPPGPKPKVEVSAQELLAQVSDALARNAQTKERQRRREQAITDIGNLKRDIERLRAEADAAEFEMNKLQNRLDDADPLPELIDVKALEAQVADAIAAEKAAAQFDTRDRHEADVAKHEAEAARRTEAMEERRKQVEDAVAKANLGVPGLSFTFLAGEPRVLLAGVPFDQASDAERLRASLAVAMAGNPKLRIIRCKDGSLLDKRSLGIVAELARENDFQVWMERVTDDSASGIHIEDGGVDAIDGEPT